MAATASQVSQLRRMIAELDDTTYSDEDLEGYIEAYPTIDEFGESAYEWDTGTEPPTQDDNDNWVATYDLHAAAADLWQEKAANVAHKYDFAADGGNYSASQQYEMYMKQSRHHLARRKPGTIKMIMSPLIDDTWEGLDSDLYN